MKHVWLSLALLSAAACSSRGAASTGSAPTPESGTLYSRVPSRIGAMALTERSAIAGLPLDSVYRFSDGSPTRVTVILYDVTDDLKGNPDPQMWTAAEGAKFPAVQEVLKRRGQIADYTIAFADTTRLALGGANVLEHFVAAPVRLRNGRIMVEMQHLYLIGGRFVKVRSTIPEAGWQTSVVPTFARELARLMAGGS